MPGLLIISLRRALGYFASVATNKKLKLWDIRSARCSTTMNGQSFAEMNSVCLSNSFTQIRAEAKNKRAEMFLKKVVISV